MVEKSEEICERCGSTIIHTRPRARFAHFRRCRGKCKNCWDRGIPCRKAGGHGGCLLCRTEKLECSDYKSSWAETAEGADEEEEEEEEGQPDLMEEG
jgi:hypothetical protein